MGTGGLKTEMSSEDWVKGGGGGAVTGQTEIVAAKFTSGCVYFVCGLLNELSAMQGRFHLMTG